jgi:superfamily II DNA or RNA helicase
MAGLTQQFQPGNLVRARAREWVVLPEIRDAVLKLRPLGGSEDDATVIYLPLEHPAPEPATFPPPNPAKSGSQAAGLLMRDALRLKLRAGAGPFRSFGNLAVEPRAYQLVPLLMALRHEVIRLLIADDVGIGKTIEAGLIAREMLDRGEIERISVVCPPHLCEQWAQELASKFLIDAEIVRTGTAGRLERGLPAGQSLFEVHPFTVVSLDYIKSERRRDEFVRACPDFVIVEEAHTCAGGTGASRHLRYQLLRDLADHPERHMVFLTATPHSGDEEAFHRLLGLLDLRFSALQGLSDDAARTKLREDLAHHFVQRRRPDIQEWKDSTVFADRETKETTYALTGEWGRLFDEVLAYTCAMVERAEGRSKLQQRMNWWAALALLRCVSSSPAAAAMALRTRLSAARGLSEEQQVAAIERAAAETVLDGESDDELTCDETVPAGTTEDAEINAADAESLGTLIKRAEGLKGPDKDPKLAVLVREVKKLVSEGFRPVIFCRYIATAHYVAGQLRNLLPESKTIVSAVTGELTPEEREERVHTLSDPDETETRTAILVATDCLSEGINLQNAFNAVIHYDLVWNPTRHEQREGRVDRFGQPRKVVRALMLYGENNPVDGAVLKVILKKAEKIRKELGVSVPMSADNNKVMETIMQTVLLRTGGITGASRQFTLNLGEVEEQLDANWESARDKAKESRTIFAQRRLRPEEVLPEWQKTVSVLGGEEDVRRFVRIAAERLNAPLEPINTNRGDCYRLPSLHLPLVLRERLATLGIEKGFKLTFSQPAPSGIEHVHRTHRLVAALSDYVAELALEEEMPDLAARSGAIFTSAVMERTTLYLLRLRNQVAVETLERGKVKRRRDLLSEECLTIALSGAEPTILSEADAAALIAAEPSRNMVPEQRRRQIERALEELSKLDSAVNAIARGRARDLHEDHTRVRAAGAGRSEAAGQRAAVKPCLPVDVIGVYVLIPTPKL